MEAAQDDVVVDERHEFLDLCWGEQFCFDAPGLSRGHTAVEFVHAFLGAGDFDAT